jgi:hypothetical protein
MRRTTVGCCLALALVAFVGCKSSRPLKVMAPPLEEEYRLPPDEARYSQAPRASKLTDKKKTTFDPRAVDKVTAQPPPPTRAPSAGGMRSAGY